jgi:protein-disulfide isomerase
MTSPAQTTQLTPPVSSEDHSLGPEQATVTLVEYADYECPYCGEAAHIVADIREQLGDRVRFVFRNFPLIDTHPHALQAAEAAEAAGLQGRFWEMHDLLFEHQRRLDPAHLAQYARQIGLDLDKFERDMAEHTTYSRIEADLESGERSGVDQTPSFFINGERFEGDWESDDLLGALERRSQ